ncbi:MAG: hypothetical protein M3R14_06440 [Acidobacteriota bacterium]|nr:hypothetical protein [Acidobacteriota bacterium]
MSKPIYEIVDELPTSGMTVTLLKSLDFVVPGQWQNITGFDNTIRTVTGETDEQIIQQIGERAIHLYNDKTQGYQTALWIYDAVGKGSGALGAAALANKFGENFSFLSFLSNLTPKADTAQAIDLSVKLVAEIVAYCKINGIPGDSIGEFVSALADYSGESLMRMAALVSVDALLPLGPDFIGKVSSTIGGLTPDELQKNQTFNQINNEIPGGDTSGKLGFIGESFRSVSDWMGSFVSSRNLTQESVASNLKRYIDITDNKLDYVSAFLDMTTNYYEHTGVQTLARRLTERAVAEI